MPDEPYEPPTLTVSFPDSSYRDALCYRSRLLAWIGRNGLTGIRLDGTLGMAYQGTPYRKWPIEYPLDSGWAPYAAFWCDPETEAALRALKLPFEARIRPPGWNRPRTRTV